MFEKSCATVGSFGAFFQAVGSFGAFGASVGSIVQRTMDNGPLTNSFGAFSRPTVGSFGSIG